MEIEQVEKIAKESKGNCLESTAFTTIWPIYLFVYASAWLCIKIYFISNDGGSGERLPCFVLLMSDFGYFLYVICLVVVHVILICINCFRGKEKDRKKFLKDFMVAEAVLLLLNVVVTTIISVGTNYHKNHNCPNYVTASLVFAINDWILCLIRLVLIVVACRAK